MDKHTLAVAATSPDDLAFRLTDRTDEEKKRQRYINLAICSPEVLVQPFNIPGIKVRDVRDRLQLVSVELLNLPADQLAFDYQILSSDGDRVSGLFVCAPKSLITECLQIIRQARLQPLKIAPYILSSIDAFYQQNEAQSQRFCLLDFTRNGYINLAVIHQQRFELLRKVPYESFEEALLEINRSLRSACAKSSVKKFDRIYLSGLIPQQARLIAEIEEQFETKTLVKSEASISEISRAQQSFFSINLIREQVVCARERSRIALGFNILLAMLFGVSLYCGMRIRQQSADIQKMATEPLEQSARYVMNESPEDMRGVQSL
ncbi:MAG: hypothetical protein KC897_03080 [Candidatus Omnitrophica bacterium]|nr:hypothetical protein [Candidatus Omnitrophota bacterium]MCB9722320.1 hypothetical protein [Candidatus Omnitrophota bacterium]